MSSRLGRFLTRFKRDFKRGFSHAYLKTHRDYLRGFTGAYNGAQQSFTTAYRRNFQRTNAVHQGFAAAFAASCQATSDSFQNAYSTSFRITAKNAPAIKTLSLTAASFLFGLIVGRSFLPVATTIAGGPTSVINAEEKSRLQKLEIGNFSVATLAPEQNKQEDQEKSTKTTDEKPKSIKESTQPVGTFKIAGKTLPLRVVSDTKIESSHYANLLSGYQFVFAHDYILPNLSAVTTFSINRDGTTETYKVIKSITIEKQRINMTEIVRATYDGQTYDLALMTCAGRSLGGGDATHRLILFAEKL